MLFFILLSFLFISIDGYAQVSKPTEFIQQEFDVISYNATIDLTEAPRKNVKAFCTIKFAWTGESPAESPTQSFYFHLCGLQVDSIHYDKKKIDFSKSSQYNNCNDYYYITRQNYDKDTVLLTVYYSGEMTNAQGNSGWAGVISRENILYAMGVGFSNDYVSATRHWLPCYDHPSDKATLTAHFLVQEGKTVAGPGNLTITKNLDDTYYYSYSHNFPTATYLMTFAVGNYILLEDSYGELPIEIYTLASDSAGSEYYYQKVPEMIAFYESLFGKYPFEKVGFVNTPTGSMEHQTMISMDQSIIRKSIATRDSLALTAAHELSHQWFGNSLSPLDFRHTWLNESFATYCEALWIEHNFGFADYLDYISDCFYKYSVYTGVEGVLSLYDYSRTGNSSNFPYTIYKKGAAVLALLRYNIGDSAFFDGIRHYIDNHQYSNVVTSNLQNSFEVTTGENLDYFFDQWVYSKGHPVLDIEFNKSLNYGADSVQIIIRQVQADSIPIFSNLPLIVSFICNESDRIDKSFILNEKEHVFTIYDLPEIFSVEFNKSDNVRVPLFVNNVKYTSIPQADNIVRIYPNPANHEINLQLNFYEKADNIEIFNSLGFLVDFRSIESGSEQIKISIDTLPKGLYFVRIGSSVRSFIKE